MKKVISLSEVGKILTHSWYVVLLMMGLGYTVAFLITTYVMTPQYTSTTQLLVSRQEEQDAALELGEIQTNISLINTYRDIIYDSVVMEAVVEKLDSTVTTNELQEKVQIVVKEDSQIFGIQVMDSNPERAAQIANFIATTFKENINDIISVENVAILSTAKANVEPVSPNVAFNKAIGAFAGMLLGMAISLIGFSFDNKVRDEDIITEELGWVNLGTVTEMPKEIALEMQEGLTAEGTQAVDRERTKTRLSELKGL